LDRTTASPSPAYPGSEVLANPSSEFLEQSRKLEELVQRAEQIRDPVARAVVHECLQSLLAFYGNGLGRMLNLIQSSGEEGALVLDRLLNDQVVRGLLLIHDLHPLDLPSRLRQAIDKVRPYMESHGGNIELLSLENNFAKLRFLGACKTCPASLVTAELSLRRAIEESCPDLSGFEVLGAQPPRDNERSP
jgi:Fe-S cluster biogenesis protein NfuA